MNVVIRVEILWKCDDYSYLILSHLISVQIAGLWSISKVFDKFQTLTQMKIKASSKSIANQIIKRGMNESVYRVSW